MAPEGLLTRPAGRGVRGLSAAALEVTPPLVRVPESRHGIPQVHGQLLPATVDRCSLEAKGP